MDMKRFARRLASRARSHAWFRRSLYDRQASALTGLSPEVLACKVAYNKYGGYCVPLASQHRPAARKILSGDIHEPDTIAFLLAHCGTGDIVHAGTYFGDFLPALSNGVAPGAKVWAFEPNRENFRCAAITRQINGLGNVELTHAGLGSRGEALSVRVAGGDGRALGGASTITAEAGIHTQPVRMITVDGAVGADRNVSVIQLDVEGYEQQALDGALATIRRCLPILVLEILPSSTLLESEWFFRNVRSLGYAKVGILHTNAVFACGTQAGSAAFER